MAEKGKAGFTGLEVAVIGMAGRFPGARNIQEFWDNLKNGVESISFFTEAELEAAGVERELFTNPNYVKAKGLLQQVEYFDNHFFGYNPKDAQMLDPQTRIFTECVWEVLEDAGYDPYAYQGLIGLYAGAGINYYWEALALTSGAGDASEQLSRLQLMDKGFLPTRISYNLNLRGPSVYVYTACSTSLMAVHMACRALLTGECQIALAGGVTLLLPQQNGYLYQEGMISSPDGHCRAFDAGARGSVFGEGAGVVALKMLKNAVADGDHIYAVIKGTAINNDGMRKVGYVAPSIEGQADVIRAAQRIARVEPESISYIETHGTGTILGDPIEIEALKRAFRSDQKQFCRIGSVKTNIGHVDSAAGIAGFIKTVLALYNKQIPPSLHYERPNPKIDFENSPFFVNTRLTDWKNDNYPLRAGVSSFGIGGTNAHVVVEEPPPEPVAVPVGVIHESPLRESPLRESPLRESPRRESPTPWQLIMISAKTKTALAKIGANLAGYLQKNPGIQLADFAYTLTVGRTHFPYRRTIVCHEILGAMDQLLQPGEPILTPETEPEVTFMFPGQGSQYPNLGRELYQTEAVFREEMNRCREILKPILNEDIISVLYPENPQAGDEGRIYETALTQPVIFSVEYALATLLMKWGLKPCRMIGHSVGEYVAACLAGVFSLEDALTLVARRGQLMQEMAEGAMLSVPLGEAELTPWLTSQLSLAAVNGPALCVVSGPQAAIEALEEQLEEKRITSSRLPVSHAFHSAMMEPALPKFREQVRRIQLSALKIPYVSNVSGTWITTGEAMSPDYWVSHLRNPVRFSQGLIKLLETGPNVFIEVGGGRTLTGLMEAHPRFEPQIHKTVNSMRHPKEAGSDLRRLLTMIGQLWGHGVSLDWNELYNGQTRRRLSLPTYPFERQRFWLDGNLGALQGGFNLQPTKAGQKRKLENWFYTPGWKRSELVTPEVSKTNPGGFPPGEILIFTQEQEFCLRLTGEIRQAGANPIFVKVGPKFFKESADCYDIDPHQPEDYRRLFGDLQKSGKLPTTIIHLWMLGLPQTENIDLSRLETATDLGFYSLLYITQAIGALTIKGDISLTVLTNNMQPVTGRESLAPEQALVLGPVKIIPQEYQGLKLRTIDLEIPASDSKETESLFKNLLAELTAYDRESVVAWRENERWIPSFESVKLNLPAEIPSRLRPNGVYLITGGLGGIGLTIAKYLAQSVRAKLALIGRSPLPPRAKWGEWLQEHSTQDQVSQKIWKVKELEELGGTVITVNADIADLGQMQKAFADITGEFGKIDGVIHCAGVADGGIIQLRNRETTDPVLAPKVNGTLVLDKLFRDQPLDFVIICSSLASVIPTFGQVGYTAANGFLDAYARYKNRRDGTFTVAVNWDNWQEVGIAAAHSAAWANPGGLATMGSDGSGISGGLATAGRGDSLKDGALAIGARADSVGENEGLGNDNTLTNLQSKASADANTLTVGQKEASVSADVMATNPGHGAMLANGILPAEGIEVFKRLLNMDNPPLSQVMISTCSLTDRYRQMASLNLQTIQNGLPNEAPRLRYTRPDLPNPYVAPRNEMEAKLAEAWQEALGINNIGVMDNFLSLGGDSLKAMKVLNVLRKYELTFEMKHLFEHPVIEELAPLVKGLENKADQGIIQGEIDLLPAQQRFFSRNYQEMHHWNIGVMVYRKAGFDEAIIKKVFDKLVEHHDALRVIYKFSGNEISQYIRGMADGLYDFAVIDLHHEPNYVEKIKIESRRLHESIDLTHGPLMKSVLFQTLDGSHLLIVIHHSICDGFSNGIFFQDFRTGYEQVLQGEAIRFLPKTDSLLQWTEKITQYSTSQELLGEIDYWKTLEETPVEPLPKDFDTQTFKYSANRPLVQNLLSATEMDSFLKVFRQGVGVEVKTVLLTALGLAIKKWTGRGLMKIHMISHGRDHLFEGIDISRTMGWFSNHYPILLDVSAEDGILIQTKRIQKMLNQIPNHGFGYEILRYLTPPDDDIPFRSKPWPEISFNYYGEGLSAPNLHPENELLTLSPIGPGLGISPNSERDFTLVLELAEYKGKLNLNIQYNRFQYQADTIIQIARWYRENLLKFMECFIGLDQSGPG